MIILIISIVFILFLFFIYYKTNFYKDTHIQLYNLWRKENMFRFKVYRTVKKLKEPNDHVLYNVNIPINKEKSHYITIDCILFSQKGVFVINTNYFSKSLIKCSSNSFFWKQIIKNEKNLIVSPSVMNDYYKSVLKTYKKLAYNNIVLINNQVSIDPSIKQEHIITLDEYENYLNSFSILGSNEYTVMQEFYNTLLNVDIDQKKLNKSRSEINCKKTLQLYLNDTFINALPLNLKELLIEELNLGNQIQSTWKDLSPFNDVGISLKDPFKKRYGFEDQTIQYMKTNNQELGRSMYRDEHSKHFVVCSVPFYKYSSKNQLQLFDFTDAILIDVDFYDQRKLRLNFSDMIVTKHHRLNKSNENRASKQSEVLIEGFQFIKCSRNINFHIEMTQLEKKLTNARVISFESVEEQIEPYNKKALYRISIEKNKEHYTIEFECRTISVFWSKFY